jgi:hypothetical protein
MATSENGNDALSTSQAQTCRTLVVWSRYQLAVASGGSAPQRRAIPEFRAAFESVSVAFNDEDAPGIRLRRGL